MTDQTPTAAPGDPDLRQQYADALEHAITAALDRLMRAKGYDPDAPDVNHAQVDREIAEVVSAMIPAVMAVRDHELEQALTDLADITTARPDRKDTPQ